MIRFLTTGSDNKYRRGDRRLSVGCRQCRGPLQGEGEKGAAAPPTHTLKRPEQLPMFRPYVSTLLILLGRAPVRE